MSIESLKLKKILKNNGISLDKDGNVSRKDVPKVSEAWKSQSHVKHFECLDKNAMSKYLSHYCPGLDLKDIDIMFHLDRFDLLMWVHGKNGMMYGIDASYPMVDSGEVSLEVYKSLGSGSKEKVEFCTCTSFEEVMDKIKHYEHSDVLNANVLEIYETMAEANEVMDFVKNINGTWLQIFRVDAKGNGTPGQAQLTEKM